MHLDLGDLCQLIQIRQDAGDFGPGFLGVGFLGQVDGALEHAAELGQDVQSVVDVLGNLNAAASRIGARGLQATDGLTARLPSGASGRVCDEIAAHRVQCNATGQVVLKLKTPRHDASGGSG